MSTTQKMARLILWVIAAFYAYGAFVHVLNIAGLSGFDWLRAPLKWQILDLVYLVLNVVVVLGFLLAWRAGFVAFFAAALSQILLYTVFRSWIIDVPKEFEPSPEQVEYLDLLVGFHVVTVGIVGLVLRLRRSS